MTKKGKVLLTLFLCLSLLTTQLQITQANTLSPDTPVQYTQADTQIIPDTYNTGCKGSLIPFTMNDEKTVTLLDLTIASGNNDTSFVLDFAYRNKDISGTIYIENYDFSAKSLVVYNEDLVDRKIRLVFNNCKFSKVGVGKDESTISYEFNNCSINYFSGSNATFNQCRFGDDSMDGLVPFRNIQVNDCFFTNMGTTASTSGIHIDGTQIYGHEGIDVYNVHFQNCRFALPPLVPEGSTNYINACIMLSLEYSNGYNLSFNNIHVNGGGYTIYAGTKYDSLTLENVIFHNVHFGCANKYGMFYPGSSSSIHKSNILSTDSLYVASVWKENDQTHFSVTNDTNQERTLLICTDVGTFTYSIPACISGNEITGTTTYNDFPFDIDIVVPADCKYAVCFDNTIQGCGVQLRFVNWNGSNVYLNNDIINTLYGGNHDFFLEGQCGDNVSFTLKKDGLLILNGTGSTYNFHSQYAPEWEPYKDYIKDVQIESGITQLGNMLFRDCNSLRNVQLPATLASVGSRAFQGCSSLQVAYYDGTATDWELVSVGIGNDSLLNVLALQKEDSITPSPTSTPTLEPTEIPTSEPTMFPTIEPAATPTVTATLPPLVSPPDAPSVEATLPPLVSPPDASLIVPTTAPTTVPTEGPTATPTAVPTEEPTATPTVAPTEKPTVVPTAVPTEKPTAVPTAAPTGKPTVVPTAVPTEKPTVVPTAVPTEKPTAVPTEKPTAVPTAVPTEKPTAVPTAVPTEKPTATPTLAPIAQATMLPVNSENANSDTENSLAEETQKTNDALQNADTLEEALNIVNAYTTSVSYLWKYTDQIDTTMLDSLSQIEESIKEKFGTCINIVSENDSRITITGIDNALLTIPQGGQLNISPVELSASEYAYAKANGLIYPQIQNAVAFHMDITDSNGNAVQLEAPVRIRFTIPNELSGKDICLLHYASSGLEILDVVIEGNTGESVIRNFSTFALFPISTDVEAAPKMGENNTVLFLLYISLLALLLFVVIDTITYHYRKHCE